MTVLRRFYQPGADIMRWVYLVVLYLVILPLTVYISFPSRAIFSFTVVLLLGFSAAFAIGLVFRKNTPYPKGNRLHLID
jgi:hypothetical protein